MSITLYYGSGSPFAWRAWLALEHKGLAHELVTLSFSAGQHRTPEYAALNPRMKVPTLVDDGFVLYESSAIVEYLADRYADVGAPLWPADPRERALARRLTSEADHYLYGALRPLLDATLFRSGAPVDAETIAQAKVPLRAELEHLERALAARAPAPANAADYAIYPQLALGRRIDARMAGFGITADLGPNARALMAKVEALPFFQKTWPPHWKS
jgi:glutathione S-transferase